MYSELPRSLAQHNYKWTWSQASPQILLWVTQESKWLWLLQWAMQNKYGPSSIKSVEKVNDLHGVVNGFNGTFSTKKIIDSNLLVLILLVCMKCKGARLWQTMQTHVWQSSAIYKSLQHQLCIYRFFNAESTNHDWGLHQSNKGQSLEKEKTWKEHVQGILCTE